MDKVQQVAEAMVHRSFKLQKGELLVITSDFHSNHDINEAIAREAAAAGAEVMVLVTMPAPCHGQEADQVVPYKAFVSMMAHADAWLDTGSMGWLYSDAFEGAMGANANMRYFLISNLSVDMLYEMLIENYSPALVRICDLLKEMLLGSKRGVRVTNPLGMDVRYEIDPANSILPRTGIIDKPGFQTPPATLNVFPKLGSMNGTLIVNCLYAGPLWGVLDQPMTIWAENGRIVEVSSENKEEEESFRQWMASWQQDTIYMLAHVNFGLLPKIRSFTDNGILNERMWGGMNWGFGFVRPQDMPPMGIQAASHFDGICLSPTVWIDDTMIMEHGEFVYGELKDCADEIAGKARGAE